MIRIFEKFVKNKKGKLKHSDLKRWVDKASHSRAVSDCVDLLIKEKEYVLSVYFYCASYKCCVKTGTADDNNDLASARDKIVCLIEYLNNMSENIYECKIAQQENRKLSEIKLTEEEEFYFTCSNELICILVKCIMISDIHKEWVSKKINSLFFKHYDPVKHEQFYFKQELDLANPKSYYGLVDMVYVINFYINCFIENDKITKIRPFVTCLLKNNFTIDIINSETEFQNLQKIYNQLFCSKEYVAINMLNRVFYGIKKTQLLGLSEEEIVDYIRLNDGCNARALLFLKFYLIKEVHGRVEGFKKWKAYTKDFSASNYSWYWIYTMIQHAKYSPQDFDAEEYIEIINTVKSTLQSNNRQDVIQTIPTASKDMVKACMSIIENNPSQLYKFIEYANIWNLYKIYNHELRYLFENRIYNLLTTVYYDISVIGKLLDSYSINDTIRIYLNSYLHDVFSLNNFIEYIRNYTGQKINISDTPFSDVIYVGRVVKVAGNKILVKSNTGIAISHLNYITDNINTSKNNLIKAHIIGYDYDNGEVIVDEPPAEKVDNDVYLDIRQNQFNKIITAIQDISKAEKLSSDLRKIVIDNSSFADSYSTMSNDFFNVKEVENDRITLLTIALTEASLSLIMNNSEITEFINLINSLANSKFNPYIFDAFGTNILDKDQISNSKIIELREKLKRYNARFLNCNASPETIFTVYMNNLFRKIIPFEYVLKAMYVSKYDHEENKNEKIFLQKEYGYLMNQFFTGRVWHYSDNKVLINNKSVFSLRKNDNLNSFYVYTNEEFYNEMVIRRNMNRYVYFLVDYYTIKSDGKNHLSYEFNISSASYGENIYDSLPFESAYMAMSSMSTYLYKYNPCVLRIFREKFDEKFFTQSWYEKKYADALMAHINAKMSIRQMLKFMGANNAYEYGRSFEISNISFFEKNKDLYIKYLSDNISERIQETVFVYFNTPICRVVSKEEMSKISSEKNVDFYTEVKRMYSNE